MFMEDLITKLAHVDYVLPTSRDRKFVRSVGRRVSRGEALTTRQGWAFLAILRNNNFYSELGMKKSALDVMIGDPKWRMPLVPSIELRNEVRHIGDNMLGFRTSNSRAEPEFASMKSVYSNGMKIVTIQNEAQLNAVIDFIGKWGFSLDGATERYLADALSLADGPCRAGVDGDRLVIDAPNQQMLAQFALHVLGADFL
jgi:hypothetical protein